MNSHHLPAFTFPKLFKNMLFTLNFFQIVLVFRKILNSNEEMISPKHYFLAFVGNCYLFIYLVQLGLTF
jgi:hypothetical protein